MEMMHLMVNRRQVQDKKSSSLVNESTLCDGLATFAEDRPESDDCQKQSQLKHPPRWSYKLAEPDHLSFPRKYGDEAVRRKDREDVDCCEEGISTRMNNGRHRLPVPAAASVDTIKQQQLGPNNSTTSSLAFRENLRLGDGVPPEKLLHADDDSTGKFAYISLDGRLINAECATSATSIGGGLGDEEAKAWEDFAPMQRVLIVAVSAAAAAAAKHRNREEIDLLLKTVKTRESELILLRQQLNELRKQNHRNVSHQNLESLDDLAASSSPKTPEIIATSGERSFDGASTIQAKLDSREAWSSSKPAPHDGDGDVTPCKRGSDLFSSSSSSCRAFPEGDEAWATEEAKWYVNPMVESSQDFYNISTPERIHSMFSVCNPAVQGSFEWTVLRSSFAARDTVDPRRLPLFQSPPPRNSPLQVNWGNGQAKPELDGIANKEHKAMRAVCAAVVLDLRERMLTVLDKESSMVMAALDKSVEDAKAQIACMHLGVASCWNASVPKALAALSLSTSEFDNYLNETQGAASTWNDISKIEESIVSWRQYLETNYNGAKAPFEKNLSPTSCKGSSVERTMVSDERLTCSACPHHCSGLDKEDVSRLESQGKGLATYPKNSAAELTEQLIRELDKAAAKVAVMERQMKKLEQDVAGCDNKQSIKLPECTKQGLEDQVKGCDNVTELVRQIQLKEEEVAYLQKDQHDLKRKSKTRKVEEGNLLCPMASPKGYGTIYWERATGLKKTKFHTELGESKTSSNLPMTINEPKALTNSKKKEIEELEKDQKRHCAEHDKQLVAANTTKAATANRLLLLEELCKQKDCTLSFLKQDVQSLELKVHGSRAYQSPTIPPVRQNSTSSIPSSSNKHETLQKQRFSHKYAPSPSRSDPIFEYTKIFKRDVPSYEAHHKNVHHINIQKHEELTDDGRLGQGYNQETSQEYSSPPRSTIEDDCSINSLKLSKSEVESHLESEYCSSSDDSTYNNSMDRLFGAEGLWYNRSLKNQKSISSDLLRAITSTTNSTCSLSQGLNKIPTSTTLVSKTIAKDKPSSKSSYRILPSKAKKQIKESNNNNVVSNSKIKGFKVPNMPINHCRSSLLSMNSKSNTCSILETSGLFGGSFDEGSLDSHKTFTIKRKRWV